MKHSTIVRFGSDAASYILGRPPQCLGKMGIVGPPDIRFIVNPSNEDLVGFSQCSPAPGSIIGSQIFPIYGVVYRLLNVKKWMEVA